MIPERSARENTMPEKSEAEQIDELQKKLKAAAKQITDLESKLSDAQNELRELREYKSNMEERKRKAAERHQRTSLSLTKW